VGHALAMAQFLLYGFEPGADFEGQLVGALERAESGGALRILDVLFVRRDAESGDIVAIDLQGKGAGGAVAPLLGFRLDESERRRVTERALATGAAAELLSARGATLEPGAALAAVLVEHVWKGALDDAAARMGGTLLATDFVEAAALADLSDELLSVTARRTPRG
jgi:hypothetical protein